MKKQFLSTEAIVRSLYLAMQAEPNFDTSSQRIRGAISRLPDGNLYITHDRGFVSFYEASGNKPTYLRKRTDKLYLLARKRYLQELLRTLESRKKCGYESVKFKKKFDKLAKTIRDFEAGNLDVARIVLTRKQYKWFTGKYRKKAFVPDDDEAALTIPYSSYDSVSGQLRNGTDVRSKSEQYVGIALWDFAVPIHYEEMFAVNVQKLVEELVADLKAANHPIDNLHYVSRGACWWNVPKQYSGMNASGSIWHTYDYHTGCVQFYPDFTIMLADGTLAFWEHEGLFTKYPYRANASERVCIMRYPGGIQAQNIIETTELESIDRNALEEIIITRILPRLWF